MSDELRAKIGDKEVTVSVLRVDGKKLTLQFFKQISRMDWLDEDLKPKDGLKPWGRVHYKIPDEGTEWLLATLSGQLFRSNIGKYRSGVMLDHYTRDLERADLAVLKYIEELTLKEKEVEAATFPALKRIYEGSRDHIKRSLESEKNQVLEVTQKVLRETKDQERARERLAQVETLDALPQLYIG